MPKLMFSTSHAMYLNMFIILPCKWEQELMFCELTEMYLLCVKYMQQLVFLKGVLDCDSHQAFGCFGVTIIWWLATFTHTCVAQIPSPKPSLQPSCVHIFLQWSGGRSFLTQSSSDSMSGESSARSMTDTQSFVIVSCVDLYLFAFIAFGHSVQFITFDSMNNNAGLC